ncbi:MAG: hypothetical protein WBM44_08935 [Waterburya sp.]
MNLLEGIVPSLVTERIESVKAGIVGAGAFAIAELVILVVPDAVVNLVSEFNLATTMIDGMWLWQLLIGAVSGFLFGVTYRYIIRDDRNSHLNDGAVLAFALVRGLALIEKNLVLSELLSVLFLVIQSILCFAIARFVLDLAIAHKFIKPFI